MDELDLSGKPGVSDHAKLGGPADHWHLHAVCIKLPTDFEPYGYRSRDDGGADCSCGCRWWLPLVAMPYDWGVCSNPHSPRCGLLTFEHQGCPQFEAEEDDASEN